MKACHEGASAIQTMLPPARSTDIVGHESFAHLGTRNATISGGSST